MDEVPLAFIDRAVDSKSGRQIYQRVFTWDKNDDLPKLETMQCQCGQVQPAGFELCLCCTARDQMTRYRGINIDANPSGAAAFQEDAQRDVGGSFEERVKRIVQEQTGLSSASQAKGCGLTLGQTCGTPHEGGPNKDTS